MRNCWTLFLSVALALLFGSSASSQTETPQNLRKWTASWIACRNAPVRDAGVFHFRKLLRLENVPAHFIVHVSADNQFLLHVNQQRVGSGPARGDLRLTISLPSFAPEQMCWPPRYGTSASIPQSRR